MLSLNSDEQSIITGNMTATSWLFDITTVAGVRYKWSLDSATSEAVLLSGSGLPGGWNAYSPVYQFKIIPDSFKGIELSRNRTEYGVITPNDVRFAAGNPSNTLAASDFIDAEVVIRIRLVPTSREYVLPGWRFIVKRCESAKGRLEFHLQDFTQRYLKGDWPNTKLVRDLAPEDSGNIIDDNLCLPFTVGTAYIPLRSLYITDGRYYVLGPASDTYTITEVQSPDAKFGNSIWTSAGYSFTQSNKTLNGTSYRVFQAIIADSDLDGVADANGIWVEGNQVYDMPTKVSSALTVSLTNPADLIAYTLKDFGVPAQLIDDVETYSSFQVAADTYDSLGITFNGGYWFKRPRTEILAELLNSCHSVLDVGEKIKLRVLSKTSQKTIALGDVVKMASKGGKQQSSGSDLLSAFNYESILQTDSDSGYVAFAQAGKSQKELIKVLVPAKSSTAEISGATVNMPLIQNSVHAQNLGCLYFQRRFLRYASMNFNGKLSLFALQPDDVVTFDNAYFGGNYTALIEGITITPQLMLQFSLTRFKEAFDDWGDLAFSAVTVSTDTTATSQQWSVVVAGPGAATSSGDMPNALPGQLRIGQTGNYILLDPAEPVQKFVEGGVTRLMIGDLGVDDYGVELFDSAGVSILKLDGSGGNLLSGWNLSQYALMSDSGAVGMSSAVTGGVDWRFWAGHATPGSAPFRVDENGNLYASSATITGTITATAGTIGGFTVDATDGLYAGTGVTRVQMKPGSGVWAGDTAIGTAPFSVTNAGAVTAVSGAIGGWTLGATSLTSTNIGLHSGASAEILLGHATTYASAKIGLKNDGSGKIASGNFSWDTSGNVTMAGSLTSTATITGGTLVSGNIRGSNVNSGTFSTKGSYLTTAASAADTTLNVKNTSDFAASGSGFIVGGGIEVLDEFTYTGKTSSTLTGCSGVLARDNGVTIIPADECVVVDSNTNTVRIFGDDGSGTVIELVGLGSLVTGSSSYLCRLTGNHANALGLRVVFTESSQAIYAYAKNTAVVGQVPDYNGVGVYGQYGNTSGGGGGNGVHGISDKAASSGVSGRSVSSSGMGVTGYASSATGTTYGVHGTTDSSSGYDFYAAGSGTNYGPFTGGHQGLVQKDFQAEIGDIVVDVKVINKANISNCICEMQISTKPKQKSARGVLTCNPSPLNIDNAPSALRDKAFKDSPPIIQSTEDQWESFESLQEEYDLTNLNAVGEGQMPVCSEGGDIEIGDFLCTSSIPGKGMKQPIFRILCLDANDEVKVEEIDIKTSYTVAESREDVIWAKESKNIKMIACIYHAG